MFFSMKRSGIDGIETLPRALIGCRPRSLILRPSRSSQFLCRTRYGNSSWPYLIFGPLRSGPATDSATRVYLEFIPKIGCRRRRILWQLGGVPDLADFLTKLVR